MEIHPAKERCHGLVQHISVLGDSGVSSDTPDLQRHPLSNSLHPLCVAPAISVKQRLSCFVICSVFCFYLVRRILCLGVANRKRYFYC